MHGQCFEISADIDGSQRCGVNTIWSEKYVIHILYHTIYKVLLQA